jgi:hypothetical protein
MADDNIFDRIEARLEFLMTQPGGYRAERALWFVATFGVWGVGVGTIVAAAVRSVTQ